MRSYRNKSICPKCHKVYMRVNNYNVFCNDKCRLYYYADRCYVNGYVLCAHCRKMIRKISKRATLKTQFRKFCSKECYFKFVYMRHAESELTLSGKICHIIKDNRFKKYSYVPVTPLQLNSESD